LKAHSTLLFNNQAQAMTNYGNRRQADNCSFFEMPFVNKSQAQKHFKALKLIALLDKTFMLSESSRLAFGSFCAGLCKQNPLKACCLAEEKLNSVSMVERKPKSKQSITHNNNNDNNKRLCFLLSYRAGKRT